MNKNYWDAWLNVCANRFYGAMVVMKVLFYDADMQCVNDIMLAHRIDTENGKI